MLFIGDLDVCGKQAVYTRSCIPDYCTGEGIEFKPFVIGENFADGSCSGSGVYMRLNQRDYFEHLMMV